MTKSDTFVCCPWPFRGLLTIIRLLRDCRCELGENTTQVGQLQAILPQNSDGGEDVAIEMG